MSFINNYYFTKRKVISVLIIVIGLSISYVNCKDLSCANAKYFSNPGKVTVDLLKSPVNGESLRICTSRMTCCSQEHEINVHGVIRTSYERYLRKTLYSLSSVLKSRAHRFDGFFKELLTNSKKAFHDMFKRTYGIIYEQNSFLFTDLFDELEKYFSRGNVDLIEVLDTFFSVLYQRMFTVLNAQYTFDDKYLVCVSEHMKDLKPFGDVPSKLSVQLKRSFVATRTFAQSLNVAGDIVHNMINMPVTSDCTRGMTKMAGCPMCQGYQNLRPCYNYCANVMKGCLAVQGELEHEWSSFVDSIEKIAARLLGPFNIEMVVEPIDIKISEAIMNFQENSQHVSQRVFSGCGKPVLGRKKRQVSKNSGRTNSRPAFPLAEEDDDEEEEDEEDEDEEDEEEEEEEEESPVVNNRQGNNRRINEPEEAKKEMDKENNEGKDKEDEKIQGEKTNTNDLDKLIKDIRGRVHQTRNFWSKLPYQLCNENEYFSSGVQDDNCWNGQDKARYTTSIVADGLSNQQKNPEVKVDASKHNTLLNEQIYALKTINSKLKNAFNGLDVEWIDAPEETVLTAGSGSGWGGPDDDEDTIFNEFASPSSSPPLMNMPVSSTEGDIVSEGSGSVGLYDKSSSSPPPTLSSTHSVDSSDHIDIEISSSSSGPTSGAAATTDSSNLIPVVSVSSTSPSDDLNNEDNNLQPVSGFKIDNSKNKYNISGANSNKIGLTKALVSYLLPILVIWMGNSLSDWLIT